MGQAETVRLPDDGADITEHRMADIVAQHRLTQVGEDALGGELGRMHADHHQAVGKALELPN